MVEERLNDNKIPNTKDFQVFQNEKLHYKFTIIFTLPGKIIYFTNMYIPPIIF